MTRRLAGHARRLLRLLLATAAALTSACGPAWTALDPQADPLRLEQALAARRLERGEGGADGYVDAVWLCLLHGRGCGYLAHLPQGAPRDKDPLEARWATALAADGLLDVPPRLAAWQGVAELAGERAATGDRRADRLLTLAVQALAQLATRDHGAVLAWLQHQDTALRRWLRVGSAAERWQRQHALARWWLPDDPDLLHPLPLQRFLEPVALSRRLNTGLERLPRLLPAPARLQPVPEPAAGAPLLLPARDPGIYRLQARLELSRPQRVLVDLRMERPVRLWCDGAPLGTRNPEDALAAPLVLDLAAGAHLLELALPIGQNGQPLLLALVPEPAVAVAEERVSGTASWHPTLVTLLDALRAPQAEALSRLVAQFPSSLAPTAAALQRGDLRASETLPSAAAVDGLLAHWPSHQDALLASAQHTRESGQAQLAWQILQRVGEAATGAVAVRAELPVQPEVRQPPQGQQRADQLLATALAYQALGVPDLAAEAAEAAVLQQPLDCQTLRHGLDMGQDALNRPMLRRLLALPLRCPPDHLTRVFALAAVGGLEAALAELLAAQQRPDLAREASGLARLMAQTLRRPVPPRPPWGADTESDLWLAAQEAQIRGDAAGFQAALQQLLTAPGLPLEARQKAIQAGVRAPWQPFVREGTLLAREQPPEALVQGSPTAWLLDQEVVLLLPDGGALRRVHQVVQVREDAAADAVGEVRVPDGADLELARTILEDGTVILPASTADKETVSLRAVAAGTTVEFAQVAYQSADDSATGSTRLPVFSMQSPDAPVLHSEYIVLVPDGLEARVEASVAAGKPELRRLGALTAHIYRRDNLPRIRPEPRAVRPELVLPTLRVFARPGLAPLLEPWNEALAAFVQSRDAGLRAAQGWLATGGESRGRWQKLAARLASAVQNAQEGPMPGRPESALQTGKGDRAALLYTIARQAGADACLVRVLPLARAHTTDPLQAGAPLDPEDYGLELVRLRVLLPGAATVTDIWYDPAQDGGRLDHVRAGLRGRSGLLAGCRQPPEDPRVTVPALGEGADQRHIDWTLDWSQDGGVLGVGHETLSGAMAASVRAFLRSAGASGGDLARELSENVLAGSTARLLRLDGLAGDGDIELAYEVTLAADPARAEALDLELWAQQLGQTYASLPVRQTQLLFSEAAEVDITLHILGAESVADLPLPVQVQQPHLRYQRDVHRQGRELVVRRTLWAVPAVVPAADYARFAAAVRAVDSGDRLRLRRAL